MPEYTAPEPPFMANNKYGYRVNISNPYIAKPICQITDKNTGLRCTSRRLTPSGWILSVL